MFTFFRSLCAVHLVDAHYCSDPSKFVAVCLTALNAMLRIELPHINVLSKADLIEKYGKLDFNIDFYTEVLNLKYLIEKMPNDPFVKKHKKLNKAITGTILRHYLFVYIILVPIIYFIEVRSPPNNIKPCICCLACYGL